MEFIMKWWTGYGWIMLEDLILIGWEYGLDRVWQRLIMLFLLFCFYEPIMTLGVLFMFLLTGVIILA
jgi:hypothetical protein